MWIIYLPSAQTVANQRTLWARFNRFLLENPDTCQPQESNYRLLNRQLRQLNWVPNPLRNGCVSITIRLSDKFHEAHRSISNWVRHLRVRKTVEYVSPALPMTFSERYKIGLQPLESIFSGPWGAGMTLAENRSPIRCLPLVPPQIGNLGWAGSLGTITSRPRDTSGPCQPTRVSEAMCASSGSPLPNHLAGPLNTETLSVGGIGISGILLRSYLCNAKPTIVPCFLVIWPPQTTP